MNSAHMIKSTIERSDIRMVIDLFYARVRKDPHIGPIFNHHIGTDDDIWVKHIDLIEDFWSNVMRHERRYFGNPMQVHLGIPELELSHFETWLDLFERTAQEVLPPQKAELFDMLARRIGQSLWMGVDRVRSAEDSYHAAGDAS